MLVVSVVTSAVQSQRPISVNSKRGRGSRGRTRRAARSNALRPSNYAPPPPVASPPPPLPTNTNTTYLLSAIGGGLLGSLILGFAAYFLRGEVDVNSIVQSDSVPQTVTTTEQFSASTKVATVSSPEPTTKSPGRVVATKYLHTDNRTNVIWFQGAKRRIDCFDLNHDETLLAGASWDGSCYVWRVADQKIDDRMNYGSGHIAETLSATTSVHWHPTRNVVFASREGFDKSYARPRKPKFGYNVAEEDKIDVEEFLDGIVERSETTLDCFPLEKGFYVDFEANKSIVCIDVSPDGRHLVAGHALLKSPKAKMGRLTVWEIQSGKLIAELESYRDYITSVKFTEDSSYCLATDIGGNLFRFDYATGEDHLLMKSNSRLTSLASSDDYIVVGDEYGKLTVLTSKSYEKVLERKIHDEPIMAVDISKDSKLVATGSNDTTVSIRRLLDMQEYCRFTGHSAPVTHVQFSADRSRVYSSAGGDGKLGRNDYDIAVGSGHHENAIASWTLPDRGLKADSVVLKSDKVGNYSTTLDLKVAQSIEAARRGTKYGHPRPDAIYQPSVPEYINDGARDGLAFGLVGPNGKKVKAQSDDGIQLCNLAEDRYCLGFSWQPTSRKLAVCYASSELKGLETIDVHDLSSKTSTRLRPAARAFYKNVSLSPNGRYVAATSHDGVDLFNIRSKKRYNLKLSYKGFLGGSKESGTYDLIFSRNSTRLFVLFKHEHKIMVNAHSAIRSYSVPDLKPLKELKLQDRHSDRLVQDFGLSASGDSICAAIGHEVEIFKSNDLSRVRKISSPRHRFSAACFMGESDRYLLAGDIDGHIMIWDSVSEKIASELPKQNSRIWKLSTSPDGKKVFVATEEGTIRIYSGVPVPTD